MLTLPAPTHLVDAYQALAADATALSRRVQEFESKVRAAQEARPSIGSFVPLHRIELPEQFKSAPTLDRASHRTWAEQSMDLRRDAEAARRQVETSHLENQFPLTHNRQVLEAVIQLLHDAGVPESVRFAGLGEDLFRFFDDGYDRAREVLGFYEAQIQEFRNSGHTVRLDSNFDDFARPALVLETEHLPDEFPRKPTAPVLAPEMSPEMEMAEPALLLPQAPMAAHRVEPQPTPERPRAPVSQPLTPAPRPPARRSEDIRRPPHPPEHSVGPREPAPAAPVRPSTPAPMKPSTPARHEPRLDEEAFKPAARTCSVFRNSRDAQAQAPASAPVPTPAPAPAQIFAPEPEYRHPHAPTAPAMPSRLAASSPVQSEAPRAQQPMRQSHAAPESTNSSPEETRRATKALGRMSLTYQSGSVNPLAILNAINLKHPTARLGTWLTLCVQGNMQFLPQLKEALAAFEPMVAKHRGVQEELSFKLQELDEDPNALQNLAFEPSILLNEIPRAIRNDISELLNIMLKN